MIRVAAVILAGGRAERMGGRNKALLEIGGRTLLARSVAAVAACAPILVATGRTAFETPGGVPVADLDTDYAGPLAGVAAAVDYLAADPPDLLLTLAVDTPYFPSDFLESALRRLASAPTIIAAYGAQDYPTNGLWRFERIGDLAAQTRANTAPHSLKRLAERLGAERLDYADRLADDPFLNANTPEDLTFLTLRGEPSSKR